MVLKLKADDWQDPAVLGPDTGNALRQSSTIKAAFDASLDAPAFHIDQTRQGNLRHELLIRVDRLKRFLKGLSHAFLCEALLSPNIATLTHYQ